MAIYHDNSFEDLLKRDLVALKVGKAHGKQYYSVPVRILFNNSRLCRTVAVKIVWVKARNATEAANYVADEYGWRPETEVYAYGPRGGKVHRYIGWESSIANQLLGGGVPASATFRPLSLDLEGPGV
jgi:hypothetical protein